MQTSSPEWEDLASKAAELGPLRAQYCPVRWRLLARVVGWSVVLAAAVLLVVIIVSSLGAIIIVAAQQQNWGLRDLKAMAFTGAICVLLLPGYGFMVVRVMRNWANRVWVFADGFIYVKGRQILVYRWDEIAAVHHKKNDDLGLALIFKGPYLLTVRPYEGEELTLNPYLHKAEELGDLIERESLHCRLVRDQANQEKVPSGDDPAQDRGHISQHESFP